MPIAVHFQNLPEGDVPEWVHLLPAGRFSGADGRGPYHVSDAGALIRESLADGKIAIDENHAIQIKTRAGESTPARGWIVEMQARADGIWGRPEWNAAGAALMKDRAYRGISPVFKHTAAGIVERVLNVALTNAPNLRLASLHTNTELGTELGAEMDWIEQLRAELGVSADGDVLAAVKALKAKPAAHTTLLESVAAAAGVAATNEAALITALQTQRDAAKGRDTLAEKMVAMQTELQTLKLHSATERATQIVDAAINEGKPILPLREHFIARHVRDPEAVEKELAALPSIKGDRISMHARTGDGETDLTEDEKTMADRMGISHDKVLAEKKRRKGKNK